MPDEIQTGKAHIHGITNDGTAITMLGYATFTLQGADASHKFDLDRVKDETKYTKGLIAADGHLELTIKWRPSGATRAAAAATAAFIVPLAKVTLTHFKVSAFNGDWVYVGDEKLTLNSEGVAEMELKLEKYDDATQNASLTTTVSG